MNGFTLVELLIAMTLTAVIGMVLFSTYSMVMDNGKTVRNRVLERESERVFWGTSSTHIAGVCLIDDKRSTRPRSPVSRLSRPTRSTASPKRTMPQPSDDEVLLSFATSSHLADMPGTPLPGPDMRGIRPAQRQPFRRLHPARASLLRRGRRLSVVRAGACPQCEVA